MTRPCPIYSILFRSKQYNPIHCKSTAKSFNYGSFVLEYPNRLRLQGENKAILGIGIRGTGKIIFTRLCQPGHNKENYDDCSTIKIKLPTYNFQYKILNKVTVHNLPNITQNGNEQTDEQTSKAKNERMNDLTFLPSF